MPQMCSTKYHFCVLFRTGRRDVGILRSLFSAGVRHQLFPCLSMNRALLTALQCLSCLLRVCCISWQAEGGGQAFIFQKFFQLPLFFCCHSLSFILCAFLVFLYHCKTVVSVLVSPFTSLRKKAVWILSLIS